MQLILDRLAATIPLGEHAVMVMDQAGWHVTDGLNVPGMADLLGQLARAEREGRLHERIRFFPRAALLIVDEIGYLPVIPGGGNLFFQLVATRYERGAMILTSNRGFAE